jgi:hypothetical protein
MAKERDARRRAKKDRRSAKEARRVAKRQEATLPDLTAVRDDEWLSLIPRALVEEVIGGPIKWRVLRSQAEMLEWNTVAYNTCVTTDVHRRYRGSPENPLRKLYAAYSESPELAGKVAYEHNQVAVEGTDKEGVRCVELHVSAAFPNALCLQDIELANTRVPATNPLGPDQRFAGLGRGIFGQVLSNLEALGRQLGFTEMILFAADRARRTVFDHKGFMYDARDHAMAAAAEESGHQIPMFKRL